VNHPSGIASHGRPSSTEGRPVPYWRTLLAAASLALLSASARPLSAQELTLRQATDLNLTYFGEGPDFLSGHTIRCFENSLAFHKRLFSYTPSQPITVLLEDWADFGDGATNTVPWNYMRLCIEPFDYVFDTVPANERINWLMHHELTHVVVTDKAAGSDLFWRKEFHGKVEPIQDNPLSIFYSYLTCPRWYAPRWYEEGIAVQLETWMAGGAGRVLSGYDEMVFRAKVLENARFYAPLGVEAEGKFIDFQGGVNSYLYGTRFMTYLSLAYGPEKLIAWLNRTSDSERYFSDQFRKVYGLPLQESWEKWISYEREWQDRNLKLIRGYPVTPLTPIPTGILGSVSRSYYDTARNRVYAAMVRPAEPPQIVAIDPGTGALESLATVKSAALFWVCSLAYDPKGDKLFYTTRNSANWRDLNELDLKTRKTRILIKGARTGDLVVHSGDQALWGIRHEGGLSSLVRIPAPYTQLEVLHTLDYGQELVDIDLSPDGRTFTGTQIEVSGAEKLVRADVAALLAGEPVFETLHQFENNSPDNFVFSADGRYLFGTSYYTGVSNVWRYDLQKARMEAVTNAETGLFRPLPLDDREMIAYNYTATGFTPVRVPIRPTEDLNAINYLGQQVVERFPVVKTWNAGSPARVDLAQVVTRSGSYDPWDLATLSSIYPVLEGYRNSVAVGLRANLSDPLRFDRAAFTATYSPDVHLAPAERLHLKLDLEKAPWKVELKNNGSDFYDLFGPTKVSRKGYSAVVSYHNYLIYDLPETLEYTVTGAYYGNIDTLPDFQNVGTSFTSYGSLGAHLDFKSLTRTLGAMEPERGFQWRLAGAANRVMGRTLPAFYGTFDAGELVPFIKHSSIWLRAAAGTATGDPTNPLAGFYFGGFGNNWVDHQEADRYRTYTSLPGLELDEASGRTFEKGTLEWTLPPIRFRSAGGSAFYLDNVRLALFDSFLETNFTQAALSRTSNSVGAQLDCALKLYSTMNAILSFGYAQARFQARTNKEGMVSLKLLDW